MAKQRLYSEKEFNTILKRAVEQQKNDQAQKAVGLSLEDIQQIAGEVGIDPTVIADIAADLDESPSRRTRYPWYKTPKKVEVERVIAGTITEEDWPEILTTIEKELNVSGVSNQIGRMLEWTFSNSSTQYKLTFSSGDDKTKVRFSSSFSSVVVAWFSVTMVYAVGLGSAFLAEGGNMALGFASMLLVYILVRFGLLRYAKKKEDKFLNLITKFEDAFEKGAVNTTTVENKTDSKLGVPDKPQSVENSVQRPIRSKTSQ